MAYSNIVVETRGRVGLITLNRPKQLNALNDLLGGQVEASFQNINAVLQQIKAGKLRALAITANKRSPLLPQVPTLGR